MKFERIGPGEYRAQTARTGQYVWVVRESSHRWIWTVGGYYGQAYWAPGVHSGGPFATMKEAIEDAIATFR